VIFLQICPLPRQALREIRVSVGADVEGTGSETAEVVGAMRADGVVLEAEEEVAVALEVKMGHGTGAPWAEAAAEEDMVVIVAVGDMAVIAGAEDMAAIVVAEDMAAIAAVEDTEETVEVMVVIVGVAEEEVVVVMKRGPHTCAST